MPGTVGAFIDGLHVGAAVKSGGIAFYPLLRDGEDFAVELLDTAMAAGLLEVHETGTVSQLTAVNRSARRVLMLEGDIVQGGRQNRVINTTLMVPSHATVSVPTSCVERGRWAGDEKNFSVSGFMVSPLVKSSLKRSVSETVRMTQGRAHTSDQGAVWEHTQSSLVDSRAMSRTEDHLEAYRAKGQGLVKEVENICGELSKAGRIAGVAIVRSDKRAAIEAFSSTEIALRVLPRIVRAHLLLPASAPAPDDSPSVLLDEVKTAATTIAPGAGGVGEEVRMKKGRMSGLAFVVDAVTLHLNADWADDDDGVSSQKTLIMKRPPRV